MKRAYLILNIEEYGKLIAYCIENDVSVFRTYWDEKKKGCRVYQIDWKEKRCYYSDKSYFEENGFEIIIPEFYFDEYGTCKIRSNIETNKRD